MAVRLTTVICVKSLFKQPAKLKSTTVIKKSNLCTHAVSECGAFPPKPIQEKHAVLKTLAVVLPFMYGGAMLSKSGAAFLEETEIFVPDDDDN